MFTASIGPYLFSIVGLDPSTWSIPAYLKMLRNGNANTKIKTVTMHIMRITTLSKLGCSIRMVGNCVRESESSVGDVQRKV